MLVTRIIIRNSTMCVCEGDSARSSNFVLRIKITVTILFQKHSKNPLPPHQAFRLSQTNQTADIKKGSTVWNSVRTLIQSILIT